MALPSAASLQEELQKRERHIADLKKAHDDFLRAWGAIERQEKTLLREAQQVVDTGKLYGVLQKIHGVEE